MPVRLFDLEDFTLDELQGTHFLLLITSTYGDGEPPANAEVFYEELMDTQLSLSHLTYSVCGLGDSSYDEFCQCGKDFDQRFAALGANRMVDRVDCDVDFDEPFEEWLSQVTTQLLQRNGSSQPVVSQPVVSQPVVSQPVVSQPVVSQPVVSQPVVSQPSSSPYVSEEKTRLTNLDALQDGQRTAQDNLPPKGTKKRPLFTPIVKNYNLNHPQSVKETRHVTISLEGAEVSYEVGDALGVYPRNDSELVLDILHLTQLNRDQKVTYDGEEYTLFYVLKYRKDLVQIDARIFQLLSSSYLPAHIQPLLNSSNKSQRKAYIDQHHLIDLLQETSLRVSAQEFIDALKNLAHRLYSISSSPKMHNGQVELTVDVLRYQLHGTERKGVASNFLADAEVGTHILVFIQSTKSFKICANDAPMIMVGPGTGIAPFRAMLEEREAIQAPGRSWLFFGAQHQKTDFLYQEQLEYWLRIGVLSQLDCAWSRDQKNKIYVQDLMYQHRKAIWLWLEAGAYFYVCGDAKYMAQDVHKTLLRIISEEGHMSSEAAEQYMQKFKKEKRYRRDVY